MMVTSNTEVLRRATKGVVVEYLRFLAEESDWGYELMTMDEFLSAQPAYESLKRVGFDNKAFDPGAPWAFKALDVCYSVRGDQLADLAVAHPMTLDLDRVPQGLRDLFTKAVWPDDSSLRARVARLLGELTGPAFAGLLRDLELEPGLWLTRNDYDHTVGLDLLKGARYAVGANNKKFDLQAPYFRLDGVDDVTVVSLDEDDLRAEYEGSPKVLDAVVLEYTRTRRLPRQLDAVVTTLYLEGSLVDAGETTV